MRTKLTTNGRVVLPRQLLEHLGLRLGAVLDVKLEGGSIVLTPKQGRRRKATIIIDPISSIKVEVKKKHISFGWNFSCFAAHLIEGDLF
jgi:bifunctional DNA-binding transcriptional regulator/antitoxin component of YhaV-PrlF toxin-antitoxin module